jgi:hypothetical protein
MKCGKSSKMKYRASSSRSLGTVPGCRAASSATARSGTEPDVVNVQFNLGKPGNEALRNRHAASLSTSSCGHSSSIPRSVG